MLERRTSAGGAALMGSQYWQHMAERLSRENMSLKIAQKDLQTDVLTYQIATVLGWAAFVGALLW
jgi:hypothetical protein